MKKMALQIFLLGAFMLLLMPLQAWAQKPLKGNWVFIIETPIGTVPAPVTFKNKGKGVVNSAVGSLALAYRETSDGSFSIVVEAPNINPDGSALTILLRGKKSSDKAAAATAVFVTDMPDPSNPTGFVTLTGKATAERQ